MAKKFNELYALEIKQKLANYQKKGLSIRDIAKITGASRSYIHRLSMQLATSSGSMRQATERRKEAGWEPLRAGNPISWGAIQLKHNRNTKRPI
ncbi:helix-turn-helix domain-containing protein [Acetobacter conturbans]|uniref:Helix-turn-helix domain-containing protein n=1 Tax=Acetobacter conturbans TaxID=1737472 RepID=A0ABX0K2F4_9PROT|nr:helix-turn-helix domain-containing protein [Acetobacter conturbans]NHN88873.1 helix-turn-helix domain-containing protein [Acetobacter conturbans]